MHEEFLTLLHRDESAGGTAFGQLNPFVLDRNGRVMPGDPLTIDHQPAIGRTSDRQDLIVMARDCLIVVAQGYAERAYRPAPSSVFT